MLPKCSQNVAEMQPKCSRNVAEMQPKCSRNVVNLQSKSRHNVAKHQQKSRQRVAKMQPTSSQKVLWTLWTPIKFPIFFRFVVATRKIQPGEVILIENPSIVGPRLEPTNGEEICLGCLSKFRNKKTIFRCNKCNFKLCSEKCGTLEFHQLECDLLKVDCYKNLELVTPVRFLACKRKNPKKFAELMSLVSNKEVKVRKKSFFSWGTRVYTLSQSVLDCHFETNPFINLIYANCKCKK